MSKTTIIAEPGKQEVTVSRIFNAPPERVFKAAIDPKAIPEWWGPRSLTTEVESLEPKPAGKWRIVQTDPSGNVYGFHGVYHAVVPPKEIVRTFEYEGTPGHVVLETSILENLGGKTKLTIQSVFQSVADRDEMAAAGMEQGILDSHERLDEFLAKSET
ncbi:MAG: SRPBCC family protein [Bacteroidota bacterium]|nr:SRPBCC family protein [Bacteroidota bacterium]MDP4231137.1 SRPBCC family protein [Bacteroidota bacterium]MDP4235554.1 SRPBCC family protein [Bacteroidota bacterium]